MNLSLKGKVALATFVLFDVFLFIYLFNLFELKSEFDEIEELREIGVSIYPEPSPLSRFSLLDQQGNAYTNQNLSGKWSLIYFGFTSCPDICPLTMAELGQFYRALEESERNEMSIILVTVDPLRDLPADMAEYITRYNDDFYGLTGDFETISLLADELFVVHEVAGSGETDEASHDHVETLPPEGEDYLINHSGHISVLSPNGDRFAVLRPPHRDQDILKAYRAIKNFY